jgi:hypothetical protein
LWLVVMLDRSIAYQHDQLSRFDENLVPLGDADVDGIGVRLYDPGEWGIWRYPEGETAIGDARRVWFVLSDRTADE